ncbi:MAG TPA: GNAT family N-acetyltransferase [Vicinamibacterales bacterium]|nr:GNAT family N-acetyltransferase [Vicinamibacterales bacterium]
MIETATREDFEAIAALNVAAYAEFVSGIEPGSWDTMQKNLRNIAERARASEFLVYRAGGEIVGSVAYCPAGRGDPAMFAPQMAAILLLAVHPAHRGRGIARALTRACIDRARRDRAQAIALFTSDMMQSAQHLYRTLGFREEFELPPRYGVRYVRFVLPLPVEQT